MTSKSSTDANNNYMRDLKKRPKLIANNWKCSLKKIRPSECGSTKWNREIARNCNLKREHRTVNYFKIIIRILLNARSDDFAKNIIQQSLNFLRRYEQKRKGQRSTKQRIKVESVNKKNTDLSRADHEIQTNVIEDEAWPPGAQKLLHTCETGNNSRRIINTAAGSRQQIDNQYGLVNDSDDVLKNILNLNASCSKSGQETQRVTETAKDPYEFHDDDEKKSEEPKNLRIKKTSDVNKSKLSAKSKTKAGNYFSSNKRRISKGTKTSSTSVEVSGDISEGREGFGNRSTKNTPPRKITFANGAIEPGRFYSPLELEYSRVIKSKLDPSHRAVERAQNPESPTKLSELPGFSKYSIPVTVEILLAKENFRGQNIARNLVQSKITKYFVSVQKPDVEEAAGSSNGARSLPAIKSNVLLKTPNRLINLQNRYELNKPKLTVVRRDFLYGLPKNDGSKNSTRNEDLDQIIEDSEESDCVPPSYSSTSPRQNEATIEVQNINGVLDTQQREDLLAPWETDDILEKVKRWYEDSFSPL